MIYNVIGKYCLNNPRSRQMEISATNASYTAYDVTLTTPFTGKKITIDANELKTYLESIEEDVVYTRADFTRNTARMRVTVNANGASYHPSKNIVQNYINNGMNAMDAIQAYKAQLSYGSSANINGVRVLNSQEPET